MKCQRDQDSIQETDLSEWIQSEMSLLKMTKNSLMPKALKINLEVDKLILIKETLTSLSGENLSKNMERESSIKSFQMETIIMADDFVF
jgi:hypothetical protein